MVKKTIPATPAVTPPKAKGRTTGTPNKGLGKGPAKGVGLGEGWGGPPKGKGTGGSARAFTAVDAAKNIPVLHSPEAIAKGVENAHVARAAKAKARAEIEASGAPSPLDVMVATMARRWQIVADLEDELAKIDPATADEKLVDLLRGKLDGAWTMASIAAEKAAPYLHRKLIDAKTQLANPPGEAFRVDDGRKPIGDFLAEFSMRVAGKVEDP